MKNFGKQGFADGRYRSRELSADLPGYLEILTRGHRNFSARAAQELHRAERYCLFMTLVIVHGDQEQSPAGRLDDLSAIVRTNCRMSDLVSGVEDGKFAILLVETPSEGAQKFMARLKDLTSTFLTGQTNAGDNISISFESVAFPNQGAGSTSFADALNTLYQRANTRPHT